VTILAGIPLRGFDTAKGRLAGSLSPEARRRLAELTARRVVEASLDAGLDALIVTSAAEVRAWAAAGGYRCVDDPPGGNLDGAAATIAASGSPWCVIHADLPLITAADLAPAAARLTEGRAVLAPSRDGGTNLIGASEPMRFSYGPGSFARHLAATAAMRPLVIISPGLAVEIDTYADLVGAARLPGGSWLIPYLS
jgi:2-phospho-L-lactate/phosphoenolpyruvate guanylyltransferase